MDGTHLAVARDGRADDSPLVPDGPDALTRIMCFGHALRMTSEYLGEGLFDGPPEPTLDMMNRAFDRLADRRPGFTPEEFTLLVMSNLLSRCADAAEGAAFRRSAAAYILRAAPKLPDEYAPIIDDARRMLSRTTGGPPNARLLHERVSASPAIRDAARADARQVARAERDAGPGMTAAATSTEPKRPVYARDPEVLRRQAVEASQRSRRWWMAVCVLAIATIAGVPFVT